MEKEEAGLLLPPWKTSTKLGTSFTGGEGDVIKLTLNSELGLIIKCMYAIYAYDVMPVMCMCNNNIF